VGSCKQAVQASLAIRKDRDTPVALRKLAGQRAAHWSAGDDPASGRGAEGPRGGMNFFRPLLLSIQPGFANYHNENKVQFLPLSIIFNTQHTHQIKSNYCTFLY
jgi:hypothetical protein